MVVNAAEKEYMSPPHMSAVSGGGGDDHIIMMMMKHRTMKIVTVMSKCMHSLPIALEKENAFLGK